MKKLSCVLAIVLLACLLSACSDSLMGDVELNDFEVYIDGEVAAVAPELTSKGFTVDILYEFSKLPASSSGLPYTTKRGIAIGDSADKVLLAYRNCGRISVWDLDISIGGSAANIEHESVEKYLDEYPVLSKGAIYMRRYWEGKFITREQVIKDYDGNTEGKVPLYILSFDINNGKVTEIAIVIKDKKVEG